MSIPFFTLARQFEEHREAFLSIAAQTWATGRVLQGPQVAEFESRLQTLCGRKHAVAVGSCTDALAFALMAQGIGPGDEVLVTPFSFFASVSPIIRVGATPKFVDIDPQLYMMDLGAAEAAVTEKTRAILAVHIFGQTLPMARVEAFAAKHGLAIVEDAAQAIGSRDGDRPAGNMGHMSCLSFDPMKVIGAFGSGGAVVTDDDGLAQHVRQLRYHGREPVDRRYEMLGYNSQLPSAQAAMLSYKLDQMDDWQARRQALADLYFEGLGDLPDLQLPTLREGSTHNWHKFVVRVPDRDALRAALADAGIGTMVHYGRPLCDEPLIASLGLDDEFTLPAARDAAAHVLSLPCFPELSAEEVRTVIDHVRSFFNG